MNVLDPLSLAATIFTLYFIIRSQLQRFGSINNKCESIKVTANVSNRKLMIVERAKPLFL